MFYYLNGTITIKEQNLIVVDVNGVGYFVHTSLNTSSKLSLNKPAKIYTYTHIREDMFDIFGFFDNEELSFFKNLISITGVGPKAALSILSCASPDALALAIITGDEKLITQAQGIGKKIASRIVLELKDKIAKEKNNSSFDIKNIEFLQSDNSSLNEAVEALMVLGYSKAEASKALASLDLSLSVDLLIKAGLKNLMSKG